MDLKNKLFAILVICCMMVSVSAVCAANGEQGTAGSNYYDFVGNICQNFNGIFGDNMNNTNMTNDTANGTVLSSNNTNVGYAGEPVNNTTNKTVNATHIKAAGEPVNKTVNKTGNVTGNATHIKAAGEPVNKTVNKTGNISANASNHTTHAKAAGEPVNNTTAHNNNQKNVVAKVANNVIPATGNPIFILLIVLSVLGGVGIIRRR